MERRAFLTSAGSAVIPQVSGYNKQEDLIIKPLLCTKPTKIGYWINRIEVEGGFVGLAYVEEKFAGDIVIDFYREDDDKLAWGELAIRLEIKIEDDDEACEDKQCACHHHSISIASVIAFTKNTKRIDPPEAEDEDESTLEHEKCQCGNDADETNHGAVLSFSCRDCRKIKLMEEGIKNYQQRLAELRRNKKRK